MRWGCRSAALALWCALAASGAGATDPARGARLFATPPATGELACADCHSENPTVNNFGNIWSGRNAVALIQRAVGLNTGGMGVFNRYYGPAELADIAAYLGNTPTVLDFAETALGQRSAPQRVTISASSKTGLTGLSLAVQGDFAILASNCAGELLAFDRCDVDIVFAPSAGGPLAGSLQVAHSGLPTPARVALSGIGRARPPAVVALSTSALAFMPTPVGNASEERQVRLSNRSRQALLLGAPALAGSDFVIAGGTCHAGRMLEAEQACVLALRFAPQSAGARDGALRLPHDGVDGVSQVMLSGAGLAEPAPQLLLQPDVLAWGGVAPGQQAVPQATLVRNLGAAALALPPLAPSQDGFALMPGGCAEQGALAPGAACWLGLRFAPHRAGVHVAELPLGTPGAAGGTPLVAWGLGEGNAATVGGAPVRPVPLWADATRLDFDGSGAQRVAIVNRGAAAATLGAIDWVGSAAADFSLGGSCRVGLVLAPAAECELVLGFGARGPGLRSASLRVAMAASELWLSLQGRALTAPLPPGPAAPPARLAWDDAAGAPGIARTDVGAESAPQQRWLRNPGPAPVTLEGLAFAGPALADYRLLAGSTCRAGAVLASGGRCSVLLAFAPQAPGTRAALLAAQVAGMADALMPLQAQALAPAVPLLRAEPPAVVLSVAAGAVSAPGSQQRVWLRNQGAAPLPIRSIGLQGRGFVLLGAEASACALADMVLMPGQACALAVAWTGSAEAVAGGQLVVQAEDEAFTALRLPLSVVEARAMPGNQGGGGALDPALLTALGLAIAALWRGRRESAPCATPPLR